MFQARVVYGVNVVSDWMVKLRDIAGGRVGTIENAMTAAQDHALEELIVKCRNAGANCILGYRVCPLPPQAETNITGVIVYGTAVVIREDGYDD